MVDITQIIVALIGLISLIMTGVVVPYVRSKTSKEQRENILFWAKLAVKAAEKIFNESGMGVQKKEYVKKFLEEHNIKLDDTQVDVVIESAVFQMQNALVE